MKIGKKKNVTTQVLLALVPYTRQNLQLVFAPNQFFNELEKTSDYSAQSIRQAYYRAKRDKLISTSDGKVTLSTEAIRRVRPFTARKLLGGVRLMVIFDIPEQNAHVRREFRALLRELKFEQIQQSVWTSDMDHAVTLRDFVNENDANDWVKLYESAPLN